QIIAPIHDIRNLLYSHLPNIALAGAGGVVFEPGAITVQGGKNSSELAKEIAAQIEKELRGRGGR
ncbi:MAG: hypothetical protein QM401_11540, partial [Bacillota bacterium]|nr:hypothetical protein [Bacillota bacterium]